MARYSERLAAEMKKRRYSVSVSRDGGATFTNYRSAGAFDAAFGKGKSATLRTNAIEQDGGHLMKVGEGTAWQRVSWHGAELVIQFFRVH